MRTKIIDSIETAFVFIMFGLLLALMTGCSTMNKAIDSASQKNIAVGNDTWGGKLWVKMVGEESILPSFGITFGRTKTWYISLRDEQSAALIADAIRASQTEIQIKVTPKEAGINNK